MLDQMEGGAGDVVGAVMIPIPFLTAARALDGSTIQFSDLLALAANHRRAPLVRAHDVEA
jgi:hypothetical protein